MRHYRHFRITEGSNRSIGSRTPFVWAGTSVRPGPGAEGTPLVPSPTVTVIPAGLAGSTCRYCGQLGRVYLLESSPICGPCARAASVIYDDSEPGLFRVLLSHPAGLTQMISYEAADLPVNVIGQIARLETVRLCHRLERITTEAAS